MRINFVDLQRQYQHYKQEIDMEISQVVQSASFIMGHQVADLEKRLAAFVGTKYAVGCASGTDALLLALVAYGVKPGDEIITTPFTFFATAEMIAQLQAKPVFVDIRSDTYNIDPKQIEGAITAKTKGIMAVDIFGQCADYDEINALARAHKLFVIEDAAQSLGAEYKGKRAGSLAGISCTSFFPAKPLGCFGDGGMIFTNDEEKAEVMASLRLHGKGDDKYDHVRLGFCSRLDTLQAAVLLAKLKYFNEEIKARQKVARYYSERIKVPVITPKVLEHNLSVFAQYSILVPNRLDLQDRLYTLGIPSAIHYPKPLHLQKAFSYLRYKKGYFPMAESIADNILSLPMHPFLTHEEQDLIINAINGPQ